MSTDFAVPSPMGRRKMILLQLSSPLLIQVLDGGAPCQHRVCLPVPSRGGGRRSRRLISACLHFTARCLPCCSVEDVEIRLFKK